MSGKNQASNRTSCSAKMKIDEACESRYDPVDDNWTLFAPNRITRPIELDIASDLKKTEASCPFCPGQESQTPPAIWLGKAIGKQQDPVRVQLTQQVEPELDWSVRAFPNRFPVVQHDAITSPHHPPLPSKYLATTGGHEVIVDTRTHTDQISETSAVETQLMFLAMKDRINTWKQFHEIRNIVAFKNSGAAAGASLKHSHCQLIATNHLPSRLQRNQARLEAYREKRGRCIHCDLIGEETKEGKRIVAIDEDLIAYCPYASPLPMLARITTRQHHAAFEELSDSLVLKIASLTRDVILGLQKIHVNASYNLVLSTVPPNSSCNSEAFHWTLDICPRLSRIAGYEIATESYINPVMPENAALQYQEILRERNC